MRTGSSDDSTVTALVRRMRLVRAAPAASATVGAEIGVIRPVMFAEAEHVEPDPVGEFDLLHEIGEGPVEFDRFAGRRVAPGLGEGVDAKFHQSLAGRVCSAPKRNDSMVATKDEDVSEKPISRFPPGELAGLPKDVRERIEAVQEKSGFVPNVFLALARRPDEFRAFFAYHDALMEKTGGLTKAEREMIVVATSGVNDCLYCVVAHGAILRIRAKNPLIADQVSVNPGKADITPRQRAMLDFALKVAARSHEIEDADYEALKGHGFTDDDAWDIAAITAFYAMSNRLANAFSIRPNDEFYAMGREPRG